MAANAVHDDGETDAENLGPEECSVEFFQILVLHFFFFKKKSRLGGILCVRHV